MAAARRSTPENPQPSAGRILIIDDEAEIRESLETLLQLEGYIPSWLRKTHGKVWRNLEYAPST
jgi:CheY-like chemotaxis protein